jgi:DNA-binding HxlR family transcriptional regulator
MAMKLEKIKRRAGTSTKDLKRWKALMLLQEKWALFAVQTLMEGPMGFNEISRRANCVINNTTLSQRLDLLEEVGLVTREVNSTIPPRTTYELTDKGRALKKVLDAIYKWADENVPADIPTPKNLSKDKA